MEIVDLFPRSILKGHLPPDLLQTLLGVGREVLANPAGSPDASAKLAGQLRQQRELQPHLPGVAALMGEHLLPAWDPTLDLA